MALVNRQIDLHGLTVDEAIFRLGQDIPAMHSRGVDELLIIHGKGEGILKYEVLRFLRSGACSPYLCGIYPGEKYKLEGGDGVVKVIFRALNTMPQSVKVNPLKKMPQSAPETIARDTLRHVHQKREKGRMRYEKKMKRDQHD